MNNESSEKKNIGTLSVVAMIYSIIASGAFGIEEMIPECGPGMTIILLGALAIIFALPFALLCAEAGSARPGEGGSLLWVKEFLGEFWFGIMVLCQGIWSLVCNAIYIVLAAEYIAQIFPMSRAASIALKIAIVLVFYILNLLGIKESSRVENLLFAAIIISFAIVTVVGFAHANTNPLLPIFSGAYDTPFQHIGAGFAIAMWMYAGFDELSVLSGEINNSGKIIPRAIMISVPLIALSNILPTLAGLASVGRWNDWTTSLDGVGYITIATRFIGPAAGAIFVLIAAACKFATFNTVLATGSRCIMVMSDEGFGPAALARLNKRGVPFISLTLICVVTLILIPFSFTFLVILDVFFTIVVTSLTLAAVFAMKKKLPPTEYRFRIPGGRALHASLCITVMLVCIFGLLVNGSDWFLGGLLWTLSLPILYIVCKRCFKGCSAKEPLLYPVNPFTGLGFGDLKKIGAFYLVLGIFAIISRYFLEWYEGSWGAEYYIEEYSGRIFSDFNAILNCISVTGCAAFAVGLVILIIERKRNEK